MQYQSFPLPCFALLTVLLLTGAASAEHRVALLIGIHDEDKEALQLDAVSEALGRYGFVCTQVKDLENENAFRDTVGSFAGNTPTNSTALIYFRGRVDGASLLPPNGRGGYSLERALEALGQQGGSRRNLVFIDAPGDHEFTGELPENTIVTFGDTKALLTKLDGKTDALPVLAAAGKTKSNLSQEERLTESGSQPISPREKFVSGSKAGDEWVNSMGLVFCWCPPGKYIAGSPDGVPGRYPDEEQREVVIREGFWLSKYELALSQKVAKRGAGGGTIAQHKLDPMTMINHDDAKAMTRNFTASERKAGRLPSDWEYALPTEEQWEYAARAGTSTRFYFGDDLDQLPRHANFADKSYYDSEDVFSNAADRTLNDGAVKLAHVGSYQPNPWGFHDMYGNVAEWCINYAIRGGSWVSVPENCRSAYRDSFSSRNEQNFIGYRLVIQKQATSSNK